MSIHLLHTSSYFIMLVWDVLYIFVSNLLVRIGCFLFQWRVRREEVVGVQSWEDVDSHAGRWMRPSSGSDRGVRMLLDVAEKLIKTCKLGGNHSMWNSRSGEKSSVCEALCNWRWRWRWRRLVEDVGSRALKFRRGFHSGLDNSSIVERLWLLLSVSA